MENNQIKILIIDDNNDNLTILKLLIKETFPEAVPLTALNGEDGIELATANDPDVILLDIVMPGMDGFEVCRRLKADKKLSSIPIIFVTSLKADKESCLRALEAGAEAFITRPIQELELFAQIRVMLKIKTANTEKRFEKNTFAVLLDEQTSELTATHTATLNLLEDLKNENEARRRSEEALKESEMKYRELVDGSPDAIAIYIEGKIVFANRSGVSLMRASSVNELIGRSVLDFVHPSSKEFVAKRMMEVMKGGKALQLEEEKFIRLDGSEVDVEVKALPVVYDNKPAIQIIVRDITERKMAQEMRRNSEARFRSVWDNSVDGMRITDNEGIIVAVNDAYCKLVAVKREELEGQSFNIVYTSSDDENQTSTQQYKNRFSTRTIIPNTEAELPLRSGNKLSVEISNSFLESEGNKPLLLGIFRDITERKRMDEILRESEERYRAMVEWSPEAISVHRDGKLLFVNPAAVRMFGAASVKELIGKSIIDLVHPDFQQRVHEQLKKKIDRGVIIPMAEGRFIKLDGTIIDVEVQSISIVYNGKLAIHGSMRDVTERKRAERVVLERERELSTLMDNFSGMVYSCLNDKDWTMKFVSDGSIELTGYLPDELIDNRVITYNDIIYPDDRRAVSDTVKVFLEKKSAFVLEYRIVAKNGSIKNVWERGKGIYTSDGKLHHLEGIISDITDRKRAVEALVENEKKYIELFDNAPVGYHELDVQGRITRVNQTELDMLGYTAEEMVGQFVWKFVDDQGISKQRVMEKLKGILYPSRGRESNYRRKDGTIFPVVIGEKILRDTTDTIIGIRTTLQDITEQKRVEVALQENELRFRSIMHSANEAIITADSKGIIVDWNRGAEKIFGYTYSEITGKNLRVIIPAHYIDQHINGMKRIEQGGKHHIIGSTIELHGLHKNGNKFSLELSLAEWETVAGKYFTGIIRDISERKKSEEQITMLAQAIRSIGECVIITDLDNNIFFVNEAFCTTYGYEPREVLGKNISILHSSDGDRVVSSQILDDAKKGNWRGELLNRKKSGEEFYINLSTSVILNDKGESIALIGVAQDISERKKIQELQLLFLTAFETAVNGIVITNINGDIIWANNAFTNMTGYTLQEVKGKNPRVLKSNKQSKELYKNLWETILSGRSWRGELTNKRKDGSLYIDEMTITPVRNEQNLVTHFVAIKQDVTQQAQSLEQIKEQAMLLAEAHDAIFVRGMDQRILYWNKGAERMYGWSAAEVIGKDAREVLYYEKAKHDDVFVQLLKDGMYSGEFLHYTKEGKELTVDARISLIYDEQKNPKSMMSINTDITEKKNLEYQFLRTQRLDSLGTLAGGIAHDLNNVLAPIMLAVEILKRSYVNENMQKVLESVESSARRGSEIVKQILTFARGLETQKILIQPRHLVKEVVGIFKETFPRSINIVSDIPNSTWTIMVDPTHFHQLIMNLGVNARDAMPNGGTLSIIASNEVIDEQYTRMNIDAKVGRYARFSVTDTGVGMSKQILDHIFEPFFTTKEIGKGTGLGLSTVYTIVKSHKGFIDIQSDIGKGTAFNIFLPASESTSVESSEKSITTISSGNGELILIVDDEDSIREVTKRTFEAFNYTVVTASDGAEGVARYAEHQDKIVLVITDMMMPVMDGHHLIMALRKMNPTVKIIASSGLIDATKDIDHGENAVNGFIHKPYNAKKLMSLVASVLQGTPSVDL